MVYLMCFSQFFCYSSIAIATIAFIIDLADKRLYFGILIRFRRIKLLAVIVVGAARDTSNVNEQTYLVFMPQLPYYLCFFSCRTLSATKAFNFFKYAFSARRRCTSAIRSSSTSFFSFGGRPVDLRPLRST